MTSQIASSPASDPTQNLSSKLESAEISESAENAPETDDQITHVLSRDKSYQNEHGQKLFNAINCLLDDEEQLELTQASEINQNKIPIPVTQSLNNRVILTLH